MIKSILRKFVFLSLSLGLLFTALPAYAVALVPACTVTTFASGLSRPGPMIFKDDDLYVGTHVHLTDVITIVKITPVGQQSVFATIAGGVSFGASFPTDLAFDAIDRLYVAAGNNNPGKFWRITPAGVVESLVSNTTRGPSSIEFDSADNLYVTDAYADVILKNGGPFANPGQDLAFANGLLFDDDDVGQLFALTLSSILRISPDGSTAVVGVSAFESPTFALQPSTGRFFVLNTGGSPDKIAVVTPSGPVDVCTLNFDTVLNADLEFGPDGALYLSDFLGGRVLKIEITE